MKWLATLLLVSGMFGCTMLTVSKVEDGNESGLRYSLPQPFIMVTPQSDGTIDVQTVMLPDPDRTYAIEATSYLAAHDMTVKIRQGLLTGVEWTKDSSAVAAEAAKAAGEIGKAREEAEIASAKAARERAQQAATKRQEQREALEAELATAEINEAVATAELKALDDSSVPEKDKIAARVKLNAAIERRVALEQQLSSLRQATSLIAGRAADTATEGEATTSVSKPQFKNVYGAVLFKVVEETDDKNTNISLRAVTAQEKFTIYRAPEASKPSSGDNGKVTVEPVDLDVVNAKAEPSPEFTLTVSMEFEKFNALIKDVDLNKPVPDDKIPKIQRLNSKQLKVTFTDKHPTGMFELKVFLNTGDNKPLGNFVVTYKVAS